MDRSWLHVIEVGEYLDGLKRYRDGGDDEEEEERCEELGKWAEVGLAQEGALVVDGVVEG